MWTRIAEQVFALLEKTEARLLSFATVMVLCTWASAVIGATVAYLTLRNTHPRSFAGFMRFCFPSIILRHSSCRIDLLYVTIARITHPFILAPLLVTNVFFAEAAYSGMSWAFGAQLQRPEPFLVWAAILVVATLLQDFMTFYVHYLEHKVSALWELHKVHHAAEFLIPITNRRFHPLQGLADNLAGMVPVGLFLGLTSYLFALPVHDNSVTGIDAYFILNIICFYHLRHSHIPLSYPQRLEWHMLSPKQHQLHHSRAEHHWDRNFGLCFAWWDRLFGTLCISDAYETYDLGLARGEQAEYSSVVALYVRPVAKLARMALSATGLLPAAAASVPPSEAGTVPSPGVASDGTEGAAARIVQAAAD